MRILGMGRNAGIFAALVVGVVFTTVSAEADGPQRRNFGVKPTAEQVNVVRRNPKSFVNLGQRLSLGSILLSFGVQKDVRGYTFATQSGETFLYKQSSADFLVHADVGYKTCKLSDDAPTIKDAIRQAVGAPTDGDPEFNGESTLKLSKRGNQFFVQIFLQAMNKGFASNKYHFRENYEFEVAFTKGSWADFVANQPVRLEPTAAGLEQYKGAIQRIVKYTGSLRAADAETLVTWMTLSILEEQGETRNFTFNVTPFIEGTRDELSYQMRSPARGKAAYEGTFWSPIILQLQSGDTPIGCQL